MSVWDSIVGQQAVVGQMQAIVSGDPKALAQSWLICGPPGSAARMLRARSRPRWKALTGAFPTSRPI